MGRVRNAWNALFAPKPVAKSGGGNWHFLTGGSQYGGSQTKFTQPYKQSAWVMDAVGMIGRPISEADLTLYMAGSEDPVEDSQLGEFWTHPGRNLGGWLTEDEWWFQTSGWLNLCGESFWLKVGDWQREGLKMVRPSHMTEIVEGGTELLGWRYQPSGRAETAALLPEEVCQIKFWNPYNPFRGLAPMEAAMMSADSDWEAGRLTRDLARSNRDLGPIISVDPGDKPGSPRIMGEEERKRLFEQIRDRRERALGGETNVPLLIGGDVSFDEPSLRSVDADFLAQRVADREVIFAAFGIPPSMAQQSASYSIGSASDYFKFLDLTVIPISGMIAAAAAQVSQEIKQGIRFDERPVQGYSAEFDFSGNSVIQSIGLERLEKAKDMHKEGLPWSVLDERLNLGLPDDFDGYDVPFLPFSVEPVGAKLAEPGEGGSALPPEAPPASDALEMVEEAFKLQRVSNLGTNGAKNAVDSPSQNGSGNDGGSKVEKSRERWEQIHKARRPWEKRFESTWNRFLNDARSETLALVANATIEPVPAAAASAPEPVKREGPFEITFKLGQWLNNLVEAMGNLTRQAIMQAGEELWGEVDAEPTDAPKVAPAEVREAVQSRNNLIRGAGEDVWNRVRAAIGEGIDEGDSRDQIAAKVREQFKVERQRSKTIATTETTFAYERGRVHAMQRAGVGFREWLDSADGRVRPDHVAADGQVQPIDSPFIVGGERLMHPGDPNGSAEQVINCFVPDTQIAPLGLTGGISRHFSGKVVELSLGGPVNLTVTPNHPILTARGWVPAGKIVKGDQLLEASVSHNGVRFACPDVGEAVASAENLYRAARLLAVEKRAADGVVDLHGEVPAEDVNVVSFDDCLRNALNSLGLETFGQIDLPRSDVLSGPLLFRRLIALSQRGGASFANSTMGGGSSLLPSLGSHFSRGSAVALADAGLFDTQVTQAVIDKRSTSPNLLGDGVDSKSLIKEALNFGENGGAAFNAQLVRDTSWHSYDGLVYCFESESNLLIANGIVNHNCRCVTAARFDDDPSTRENL